MRRIEDADKIRFQAERIKTLSDGFDVNVKLPDLSGCKGNTANKIYEAAEQLTAARKALKSLMNNTSVFLMAKSKAIDYADRQDASSIGLQ